MPLGNPNFRCSGLLEAGEVTQELKYSLPKYTQFLKEGDVRTLISRFQELEEALRAACVENTPVFLNERLEKVRTKLQEARTNDDLCLYPNATEWIVEQIEGAILFAKDERQALRNKLGSLFSTSDLRSLVFDMAYDYESIVGHDASRDDLVREFIATVEKRGELLILVAECGKRRPNGNWEQVQLKRWPEWLKRKWWKDFLNQTSRNLASEINNTNKYPIILLFETIPTKSQLEDITVESESQEAMISYNTFQTWAEEIQEDIQQAAHCYAYNMYSASIMLAWRAVKLARAYSSIDLRSVEPQLTQVIDQMYSMHILNNENEDQNVVWAYIKQALKLVELLHQAEDRVLSRIQSILDNIVSQPVISDQITVQIQANDLESIRLSKTNTRAQ